MADAREKQAASKVYNDRLERWYVHGMHTVPTLTLMYLY